MTCGLFPLYGNGGTELGLQQQINTFWTSRVCKGFHSSIITASVVLLSPAVVYLLKASGRLLGYDNELFSSLGSFCSTLKVWSSTTTDIMAGRKRVTTSESWQCPHKKIPLWVDEPKQKAFATRVHWTYQTRLFKDLAVDHVPRPLTQWQHPQQQHQIWTLLFKSTYNRTIYNCVCVCAWEAGGIQ